MNSSTQEMYRRKIQEIANDYETRGYRVLIEPAPTELRHSLRTFVQMSLFMGRRTLLS